MPCHKSEQSTTASFSPFGLKFRGLGSSLWFSWFSFADYFQAQPRFSFKTLLTNGLISFSSRSLEKIGSFGQPETVWSTVSDDDGDDDDDDDKAADFYR